MLTGPFANAYVLAGPTGSGKTAIALDLAPRLNAEIVSMDSMALYRGMDIGTAKPTAAERALVPHHLVDVRDPWESASVAWWLEQATAACADITSRGKIPLFVGGTPLYLKALFLGLFDGPSADATIRSELEAEAVRIGSTGLHRRMAELDPAAGIRIHPNDLRRIVRALEVHTLTGRPISDWQREWAPKPPSPTAERRAVWIDRPREELYERIDRRVEKMFADGLVDEVRRLAALARPMSREAGQALGYREILASFETPIPESDLIGAVQTHSRQFAKRQIAWFRHLPDCFPVTAQLTWTAEHRKIPPDAGSFAETDSWPKIP
jgi:tRNA dimethylallyltransferase